MSSFLYHQLVGVVPVDCIVSEKHDLRTTVSKLPIESGSHINDHAYQEPRELKLEFGDMNGAVTFNAIRAFQALRQPVAVVSGLTIYRHMLIKDVTADRNAMFSSVMKGSATLQEVQIVDSANQTNNDTDTPAGSKTSLRPGSREVENQVADVVNRGTGSTKFATPGSIASKGLDFIEGLF